jgi:hypothetical protein
MSEVYPRFGRVLPVADLAAVADGDHHDEQKVVLDGVDDPVVPDANAPSRTSLELAGRRW